MENYKLPKGWSYEKAVNMGMPHALSSRCILCGKPFCSMGFHSEHHITPKGQGGRNKTMTLLSLSLKEHRLESALVFLCGSGTTGCHCGFHGTPVDGCTYSMGWVWDDALVESQWWRGLLLDNGQMQPHDPILWGAGHYEIIEKRWMGGILHKRVYLEVRNGETVVPEPSEPSWERVR